MMDGWDYGYGMGHGSNDWGWFLMVVFMVILFGVIAYLFYVQSSRAATGKTPETDDAMAILKKRYAAGEIDEKQFAKMKKAIND